MYERRSRLSKRTRDRLIEHIFAGTTARAAAELVGVHPVPIPVVSAPGDANPVPPGQ